MKKLLTFILIALMLVSFVACNEPQNDGDGGDNPSTEEPPSQYSVVLQNLLEDEYYDDLIARAKSDNSLYNTGYFYPLPYSFLEDEGYDIEQIKQGTLKSQISAYTYKDDANSLYMAVGVETKASKPYYTQYILKYNLTQQEMADYKMLHAGYYIQAVFINDAISEYKTPTIVVKNKITVEAYDAILDELDEYSNINKIFANKKIGGLTLFNYDLEKQTFEVQIRSTAKSGHTMITNKGVVTTYPFRRGSSFVEVDANNVFYAPFMSDSYLPGDNAINAVGKEITQYQSQYVYLENTNDLKIKIS